MGPGACCQGARLHLPDQLEGLHGGYMRLELPIVPSHQEDCMFLTQQEINGGGFAWAAAKSGSSSGTIYYYTPLPLNLANKQASKQATSTSPFRFGHWSTSSLRALLYSGHPRA